MLVTVSDKKIQHSTDGTTIDYYNADIVSANDYYPFGMQMPGRTYNSGNYRYGFNGKENDNEVKGDGNQQDYGMRIYDPRVGRFLSVDPLQKNYPELTPYQFSSNSPIENSDLDGAEALSAIKSGLARKWEMQMKAASISDVNAKMKEAQTRAMMRYLATTPPASTNQISRTPDEVSDRVKQLRREHYMDEETGKKTAMGRLFQSKTYENVNDNLVTPMAEMAVSEGAGKALFKGGAAAFKWFENKTALGAADMASIWQGKGTYSGVDAWRNITLKQGTEVVGGLPGQSNFYTTMSGLNRSGLNQETLWNGLQVEKNVSLGYRPSVGIYRVTENTQAAFGSTYANPNFGGGGLPQLFVPDMKKLELIKTVPLKK